MSTRPLASRGAIDLGGTVRGIHQHRGRHRVAARVGVLRADQRQQFAARTGPRDAVHRVVRVVAGVVLGTRRDDRAVHARARGRRGLLEHAAQERAVGVERQAELGVDEVRDGVVRQHVAGQALLRVALRGKEVELTALLAHQHVRAGDVCAARQVEADERNLARAPLDIADGGAVGRETAGPGRARRAPCASRAPHRGAGATTVAAPVMKPCARKSRRVTGACATRASAARSDRAHVSWRFDDQHGCVSRLDSNQSISVAPPERGTASGLGTSRRCAWPPPAHGCSVRQCVGQSVGPSSPGSPARTVSLRAARVRAGRADHRCRSADRSHVLAAFAPHRRGSTAEIQAREVTAPRAAMSRSARCSTASPAARSKSGARTGTP